MGNKGVLELFRDYSELEVHRIDDDTVKNDIIPRSLEFMKSIVLIEDIELIEKGDDFTTEDLIYDSALAQLCAYFAYLTFFRKTIDRRTNLYNFEVHYQEALSILFVKAPRRIVMDEKHGIYRIVNFQRTSYVTGACRN